MQDHITNQLDEAVAQVFATMLDLVCSPVPGHAFCPAAAPSAPHLTASVSFTGALTGFCALQVDEPAAADLTAHLTGIAQEALSPELFSDTVAELCNMIAGCWKSMQPAPQAACHLSTPAPTAAFPTIFPRTLTRLYSFELHHLTLALGIA